MKLKELWSENKYLMKNQMKIIRDLQFLNRLKNKSMSNLIVYKLLLMNIKNNIKFY